MRRVRSVGRRSRLGLNATTRPFRSPLLILSASAGLANRSRPDGRRVLSGDFGALALAHSLAALWRGLRIAYARCARLVVQRSGDAEPERRELGTLAFLFCAFVRGKN